ncbi:2-dehydropantoate 2-reductase (Ketopantoate reductase) (KPA reductase) (KPR) [Fusarium oxysporum]|nr:2-dehydropantoate 2-reductase (Ketopantoate reductase) (KPA reductase) (KPR) [Fusarium oxysporum]WKT43927.1 Ketopantoate reductase ApbA/PanE [Fusarium oxysporum f. sp. vasinfectum]KAJ4037532.1 2-dehydropantoate 2-reductase (Ketopantoate reductase) (KPA reductase) (KPR) [Fusarium oxysporum]KAJ4048439.1 2-dehydropantoate 2-reductase (Ketopantoate reductase) (KPA reductase) (KPR) [Fusarium oxysporum]KAJ4076659.1 2-dehydropantoate 2-reductase (Ketopantoate reductase) (KPA reductase) (KPR) [Fusar
MIVKAVQPRVHVLGLGSIGTFAAHSLAEVPPPLTPSVTLLLHRASLVDQYVRNGSQITLETREGEIVNHGNYNLEVLQDDQWHSASSTCHDPTPNGNMTVQDDIIDHLVVSVKGPQTSSALQPLKHRLNASSHILFLQNGTGMIEDVKKHVFTKEETRPNFITGVISHGVTLNSPFNITHTGFAATSLGLVPRGEQIPKAIPRTKPYLLEALALVPRFNATSYSFLEVFQIQLEKLAVNAFCNPLCALNDAKNKFLFTIPETRRALLTEISQVVCALPELRDIPGVPERFSVERLEATVDGIIQKTAETTCSMVVDLRRGQKTEIQFINGYWCRRGREVGVPTPINDKLVREILERQGDAGLALDYT